MKNFNCRKINIISLTHWVMPSICIFIQKKKGRAPINEKKPSILGPSIFKICV